MRNRQRQVAAFWGRPAVGHNKLKEKSVLKKHFITKNIKILRKKSAVPSETLMYSSHVGR